MSSSSLGKVALSGVRKRGSGSSPTPLKQKLQQTPLYASCGWESTDDVKHVQRTPDFKRFPRERERETLDSRRCASLKV